MTLKAVTRYYML